MQFTFYALVGGGAVGMDLWEVYRKAFHNLAKSMCFFKALVREN